MTSAAIMGIFDLHGRKCCRVGFGDLSVSWRFQAAPILRSFFYSKPSGKGWGRAQWEAARPAGSTRPVRQPVVCPASLLARGLRVFSNSWRPHMCEENTHPDSDPPLTLNGYELDKLPITELIALRQAAHDCQQMPEMARVKLVLAALVEANIRAHRMADQRRAQRATP